MNTCVDWTVLRHNFTKYLAHVFARSNSRCELSKSGWKDNVLTTDARQNIGVCTEVINRFCVARGSCENRRTKAKKIDRGQQMGMDNGGVSDYNIIPTMVFIHGHHEILGLRNCVMFSCFLKSQCARKQRMHGNQKP